MPNYFSEKKRKKELPVRAVCRNCGTGLHGRYCHCCGQDLFKGTKRTVGSLVFHAVENVFSIDNRLLISMKCLLFRPGKLTKEYINGRIVRYVHPSKLFWFISIVFFLLLTTRITTENSSSGTKETAETVAGIPPETSGAADILAGSINRRSPALRQHAGLSGDAADRKSATKTDKLEDKVIQTNSDGMFIRNLLRYAPYVSFLLIPFFAFLLNLFFRRRELFYADHLVFALHF
ncbi:MAG: DUF3667 domain-containing protein, partial [Tannerella sp.]|nr:DUF3667 domain-containing protein [Tannerella sp.]